ncbi:MAG: hypothetical protein AAGI14_10360 [Pseudomonadota bacterium]
MADYLVMFRNFLVALILGWLGFSLQPDDGQDKDAQPQERAPQMLTVR